MPRFSLDSSCMVAAVCTWHEHHAATEADINTRLARGERMFTPAHALTEAYAVLTRLPPPHRLSPADAWAAIDASFVKPATVIALTATTYKVFLRRLAAQAIAGGRTYDSLIGECARRGHAETLLTLNPRHFDPAPEGVSIVDPSLT